MVERMLDKYTGLGTALDKMNDELEDATEAMHQLRAELELADLKASSRVNAVSESHSHGAVLGNPHGAVSHAHLDAISRPTLQRLTLSSAPARLPRRPRHRRASTSSRSARTS